MLALKANQETMHAQAKSFLEDAQADGFPEIAHDTLETRESGHGRKESRRYWITADIDWLTQHEPWPNLRSVGLVESIREVGGQATVERRFYLASIPADAKNFARAVRGHWAIENTLHWSLDGSFAEDQCRVRSGHAAENLAVLRHLSLRHLSLHLLTQETTNQRGIKTKQKVAGWDHSYLLKLLAV